MPAKPDSGPTAAPDETGAYLGSSLPKKPRRARDDGWAIEDHICRVCFSRVLSRATHAGHGERHYRCVGCGHESTGHTPAVVCACGLKLKGGKDLGVRCIANDQRSPEAPHQIVARQVVM